MATNQIHYKSMRGMEGQRNDNAEIIQEKESLLQQSGEEGWRIVERRKKGNRSQDTMFVSDIPEIERAKTREIWDFFNTVEASQILYWLLYYQGREIFTTEDMVLSRQLRFRQLIV